MTLGGVSVRAQEQNPAVQALGVAVAARVPVLLWGAPGTGKTSAIRAMAQAMGLPVIPSPRVGGMKRFAGTVGRGQSEGRPRRYRGP